MTLTKILLLSPVASYPLPLLSISTHLALLSSRLPALVSGGNEDPLCNDDWAASVPLYAPDAKPPVTLLVISVGENVFFDPSREELAVADSVLALTVTLSRPKADEPRGVQLLFVRTIDPPARSVASSSAALGGEPGFSYGGEPIQEGSWQPRQGGIKRGLLGGLLAQCTAAGGVAEEVISGLEAFAGHCGGQ